MSEIAQLRQQITEQEQSARLWMFGPAIVASHDAIIARMEQNGPVLIQMIQEGRGEEALAIMNNGWNFQ
jgi:hypothetical protein